MNEGVRIEHLTSEEKFVRFKHMRSYIVPRRKRHQIVHNQEQEDIGIAVSRNGRKDFRKYDEQKVYRWNGNRRITDRLCKDREKVAERVGSQEDI